MTIDTFLRAGDPASTGAAPAATPAVSTAFQTALRVPTRRRYLMCRPDFFEVSYAINPWMDPTRPVDQARAIEQWETLRATYERLGHTVELLPPVAGLPDMVFAANGAFVVGDRALGARFRESVRGAEAHAHRARLTELGVEVTSPVAINEGEGDFAWAYGRILAGAGFRAEAASRQELADLFGLPVVALDLVDPLYYHLDTALAVLDATTVAYLPSAFSAESRRLLQELYPDAIEVDAEEAAVLALNAVSDGLHVVLPTQAPRLAAAVRERGFEAVPVDVSELLAAGGGIKCTTLELHRYVEVARDPAYDPDLDTAFDLDLDTQHGTPGMAYAAELDHTADSGATTCTAAIFTPSDPTSTYAQETL